MLQIVHCKQNAEVVQQMESVQWSKIVHTQAISHTWHQLYSVFKI